MTKIEKNYFIAVKYLINQNFKLKEHQTFGLVTKKNNKFFILKNRIKKLTINIKFLFKSPIILKIKFLKKIIPKFYL